MEPIDTIDYRGYTIRIIQDEDSENPFNEDGAPILVLHNHAEQRFGWTTDEGKEWAPKLEYALEQIHDRGVVRKMYGPGGALDIVNRWLRVAHRIPAVLPVSALDHSGVTVYLAAGDHPQDPGGWDSGWIGWLFMTPEQAGERWEEPDPVKVEASLRAAFEEFAAWVSGDVVGYQIVDPDGRDVEDCYGFYGSDLFDQPDGWGYQQCRDVIDDVIAQREAKNKVMSGGPTTFTATSDELHQAGSWSPGDILAARRAAEQDPK